MKKEIYEEISKTIKIVWKKDIKKDYNESRLINEDTLKNALYYHLRRRIGKFLEENNLRIYTEFQDDELSQMKYRPDIVIAQMDFSRDKEYLIEEYKSCVAIIEIKFQGDTYSAPKKVYEDYEKMKKYAKKFGKSCLYYMATIWEAKDNSEKPWLDEEDWERGVLTELNASYNRKETMKFAVIPHEKG